MDEQVKTKIKEKADELNLLLFELEEKGFENYFPEPYNMLVQAATLLYQSIKLEERPTLFSVKN